MARENGFSLVELLIVIVIIGIIAAIAVPALLRARVSANEGAAIGDTRAVISAGVAYESASQGNGYARLITCYSVPSAGTCLGALGYSLAAPTFLDPSIAAAAVPVQKQGYDRTYGTSGVPLGSLNIGDDSFCYQSVPSRLNRSGIRNFGGDNVGVLAQSFTAGVACCKAPGPGYGVDTVACSSL